MRELLKQESMKRLMLTFHELATAMPMHLTSLQQVLKYLYVRLTTTSTLTLA